MTKSKSVIERDLVTPRLMADGRNQRVQGDDLQASWDYQLLAASTTGKAWVGEDVLSGLRYSLSP
jgi:hypothetical protein